MSTKVDTLEDIKLKLPPRYVIIIYNDDKTTIDFVVYILNKYFGYPEKKCIQIAYFIHENGEHVIDDTFSLETAETLVFNIIQEAREQGFPLNCSVEEE